ncbi:UNVERIFIED_CONTAM: hypothetical protein GTU68_002343 [Idotea baltica]|nr:hypothetical protein [Idotea baltica]
MSPFISEMIGTLFLILLGNGVVANVVLNDTKGNASGWIVITFGWAMAVFAGVVISQEGSGAHLNPAVTIGLALVGKFAWSAVGIYIAAQLLGALLGACLVWLIYRDHYKVTKNKPGVLATFATTPAIRNATSNLTSEIVGTFVLIFSVLYISGPNFATGLGALPVALIVFGIGLSLGGTTGYAINPARDLGPRIAHAILPIYEKGDSDWGYAYIPVIGPLIGATLAAGFFLIL